jgi:hypothetical protein
MVNKNKIIKLMFLTLLVTIVIGGFVVTPKVNKTKADTIPGVSGSNYTQITNMGPAPANFRPFRPDSIWNIRLPENPQNIDPVNTPTIKTYAANTGPTLFITEANNAITNCVTPCAGLNESMPVYVATNSDPSVTIDCNGVVYGCYIDSFNRTSSIPEIFHIPANVRSGVNGGFGDAVFSVLQPDGTELSVYGCIMHQDWNPNNMNVIGGANSPTYGCQASGVSIDNVVTGYGYTEGTASGDTPMAMLTLYNEVVPPGATINHALSIWFSCQNGRAVYPGTALRSTPDCTGVPGLPAGTHMHLSLSHARIDALIAQGTLSAPMRPFYYAMHDYGVYLLDGGGGCGPNCESFATDLGPKIEDAAPWLKNSGTNPWIPWFAAQPGVGQGVQDTGTPVWSFRADLYQPIAPYFDVVSPCYAQGNCSDSLNQGNPTPPPPSLVAYYSFDGNTNDSSGNNFNGTAVGNPTYTTGKINQAITFNGSNYVDMGNIGNVSTAGMSVAFWVNFSSLPTAFQSVLGKDSGGGTDTFQYVIGDNGSGGTLSLNTSSASGQTAGLCPVPLTGKANQWLHLAFVWSADNSTCSAYLNGTLANSQSVAIDMDPNITPPLHVGYGYDTSLGIHGSVDDLQIYNYTLSSSQVQSIYNQAPTPLPGDINLDHIVNSIDWSIMNAHWFTNYAPADLNSDGIVNSIDFSILNANWFKTW